jgi:hypothetical protein
LNDEWTCATPEPTFLNSRFLRDFVCFLAAKMELRDLSCPRAAGCRRLGRRGPHGPPELGSQTNGEIVRRTNVRGYPSDSQRWILPDSGPPGQARSRKGYDILGKLTSLR